MSILLLSLFALGAPVPAPRAVAHFRIANRNVIDIDATAFGQGVTSQVITAVAFVSVTLSDSASGHIAHVVIDSSSFDAGALTASMPLDLSANARGAVFHLYEVNGKSVSTVVPTPMITSAVQFVGGIELLLAGLHPSKAGDHWVDTTRADTTAAIGGSTGAPATATGSRIADWTVTAADSGALQFDGTWTGTTSVGSGATRMEIHLTGTSHVTAAPGTLPRQATSTATGAASMNIGGGSLPMKLTTDVSVTPIL